MLLTISGAILKEFRYSRKMDKTLNAILNVLVAIDCDLKILAVVSDSNLSDDQKIELLETIKKNSDTIFDAIN